MRLKSSIFVSAIMRSEQAAGAFCSVLSRGSEEAGAIFIVHRRSGTASDFYGPAPQSFFEDEDNDRRFEKLAEGVDDAEVRRLGDRQRQFDPDCWIVEIEKGGDLSSIDVVDEAQRDWPRI
jgi:hypothetical protein